MGKIYEGDIKLNLIQVAQKLMNEVTEEQAKVLAKGIAPISHKSNKARFAHAVLDAYKEMPSETEEDAMSKKLCKHILDKYMKSSTNMDGEDSVFKMLIDKIEELSK